MSAPQITAVIGGGIVGICTAIALAERGTPVRLIDRDAPGQGASMGNAGVISPFSVVPQSLPGLWRDIPRWVLDPSGPVHLRPRHIPRFLPWALRFLRAGQRDRVHATAAAMHALNHDNVTLYRQLLEGTGHEDLVQDSFYVMASRSAAPARLDSFTNQLRRKYGAELEAVDAAALRGLEPALSPAFKSALLIKGQARALSPGRICVVLADKLRGLGGEVVCAKVTGLLRTDEDWQINTDTGPIRATNVVLAAGAWSARLLAPLGIDVPLEAERGYHLAFPDAPVTLNNSVMDADMKLVASSMEGALRAAGTAEFGGLETEASPARAEALAKVARQLCPDLAEARYETWSGLRPSFPDSLPAIGPIKGQPGLIAAFGHSHWGFMMGPKTGRLAASLAMGEQPNIDLSPYDPTRFQHAT
ncbi:D-amino-acid dehydrogenase [Roseovarius lutimaris]|uniref:D-amino-acid dehydrogenase n=1 Tax=Roseovarius lutimaris TaxID=1005928 RepID=A0A1I5BYC1_9RHOB|nr:FAD-dependent oxidoreductase [Roseovarius lutimaris]SFN79738.1 D-amino-acid dehydrogenase [Roseovarius lutimaris]